MARRSKVDICNMALSHLGEYPAIATIEGSELTARETVFAEWYDTAREYVLKAVIPNFATTRALVLKKIQAPVFGYVYAYEYPADALRVLGFGASEEKEFDYLIERGQDGKLEIQMGEDYPEGLPVRYIANVEDTASFSSDFAIALSYQIAEYVAFEITANTRTAEQLRLYVPVKLAEISAMSTQESPIRRISSSNFRKARYAYGNRAYY